MLPLMEIGGYDTMFHTPEPHKKAAEIMRFLGWKDAVIENVVLDSYNGQNYEGDDFFYYENQVAKAKWDIDVPEKESNDMVYFLFDPNQLTIVTDKELTEKIRKNFDCDFYRYDDGVHEVHCTYRNGVYCEGGVTAAT